MHCNFYTNLKLFYQWVYAYANGINKKLSSLKGEIYMRNIEINTQLSDWFTNDGQSIEL